MNFKTIFLLCTIISCFKHISASEVSLPEIEKQQLVKKWLKAAENGDLTQMQKLSKHIDINAAEADGYNALFYAGYYGHENIVKFLLESGINVNAQNKKGETALARLIAEHADIAKLLLQVPTINVNLQDKQGYTALHNIAMMGRDDSIGTMKLLLQIPGIDVNPKDRENYSPLMRAVEFDCIDAVKLLLQVPTIDVNIKNQQGNSALMRATDEEHPEIFKLLVEFPKTDINAANKYGLCPLVYAAYRGLLDDVRLLLQHPAININAQDNDGTNALLTAVEYGHENIVKLLLQQPALRLTDHDYSRAVEINKAKKDKQPIFEKLIKQKIELITHAFEALSAVAKIIADGTISKADRQKLFEKLKGVINELGENIVNADGKTLLDKAFELNCPTLIEFLLQNAKDPQEHLARFPFEFISPSSYIFKYFINLAYGQEPKR